MPERFSKEMDFCGEDFEMLSFGSGQRICPEMPLADRMVHLVARVLEWRLPADAGKNRVNMSENFGMILGLALHHSRL
jgi:cytochrome P450